MPTPDGLAADAMTEPLAEPRLSGTTWTIAVVDRVRRLGVAIDSGASADVARALATACPPMSAATLRGPLRPSPPGQAHVVDAVSL